MRGYSLLGLPAGYNLIPAREPAFAALGKAFEQSLAKLREIGADVWLSGLRRSQSETRSDRPFVEQQKKTLKAYPILDWADAQVDIYLHQHKLPRHPLSEKGYLTMGDWHSTRPAENGTAEGTRFNGEKFECGLHLDSGTSDFQI